MALVAVDLTRAITYRGTNLNTVTQGTTGLAGCRVDSIDPTQVEVRQFTEPLALANGLDVGGVWLGARHISMSGAVFDVTRGKAFDRIVALDALFQPDADFLATPGNYGFAALVYYVVQNAAPGYVQKTLYARSNGLRYDIKREMFGGPDGSPLAIPWQVTLLCKQPTPS